MENFLGYAIDNIEMANRIAFDRGNSAEGAVLAQLAIAQALVALVERLDALTQTENRNHPALRIEGEITIDQKPL